MRTELHPPLVRPVELPLEERTLHVIDVEALRRNEPSEVVTTYLLACRLGCRARETLRLGDTRVEGGHLDVVRWRQVLEPLADPSCLVRSPGAPLDGVVPRRAAAHGEGMCRTADNQETDIAGKLGR